MELNSKLSKEWLEWIDKNLKKGVSVVEIANILIDNKFSMDVILQALPFVNSPHFTFVMQSLIFFGAKFDEKVPFPVLELPNFLGENMCKQLIALISKQEKETAKKAKKEIQQKETKDSKQEKTKSKEDNDDKNQPDILWLLDEKSPYIKQLQQKICGVMGLPIYLTDPLAAYTFQKGMEQNEHVDAINPYDSTGQESLKKHGNRTWSVMLTLQESKKGGELVFPGIKKTFKPKVGSLLAWYNLNQEVEPSSFSLHKHNLVSDGTQTILTQWFRQYPSI